MFSAFLVPLTQAQQEIPSFQQQIASTPRQKISDFAAAYERLIKKTHWFHAYNV